MMALLFMDHPESECIGTSLAPKDRFRQFLDFLTLLNCQARWFIYLSRGRTKPF